MDYLNNFLLLCISTLDFSDGMKHKANVTRALPYIGALILFLVVTIFCFTPQFQGKELVQHDIMQYEGMTRDILQQRFYYTTLSAKMQGKRAALYRVCGALSF